MPEEKAIVSWITAREWTRFKINIFNFCIWKNWRPQAFTWNREKKKWNSESWVSFWAFKHNIYLRVVFLQRSLSFCAVNLSKAVIIDNSYILRVHVFTFFQADKFLYLPKPNIMYFWNFPVSCMKLTKNFISFTAIKY